MENVGFGLLGGMHDPEKDEEIKEQMRKRREKAERIERALVLMGDEIANRLERDAANMTNKELINYAGAIAGMATTLGALALYAPMNGP